MDHPDTRSAQIIPFPKGGRDAVRRTVSGTPALLSVEAARPEVDVSAWYHQAAMQDAPAPRRS